MKTYVNNGEASHRRDGYVNNGSGTAKGADAYVSKGPAGPKVGTSRGYSPAPSKSSKSNVVKR